MEFTCGRLRRLRTSDLANFQAYRALPELGRYQGWSAMSDDAATRFLEEMQHAPLFEPGEWVQLGIADTATDQLIGDIGLYLSEDESWGEVGFTLQPSHQGQGIATSAVRHALETLFARTRIAEVRGITDQRNTPSMRLLQRLGFIWVEDCAAEFRGERCTEQVFTLRRPKAQGLIQDVPWTLRYPSELDAQ